MSFREPMAHVRYGKNTELAGATPGVVRPMSTREADRAYRKAWRKNNPAWYTRLWRFLALFNGLKRVECSTRFFRACQEKRFLTRSQKEVSGVLSCGAASESSVSEEDAVSSSGRPAVFITNFTLARTPSALPV